MAAKPKTARAAAAKTLDSVLNKGLSLAQLLPEWEQRLDIDQRSLYKEICYGSSRWFYYLTPLVHSQLKKPLKPKDSDLFALLIIGAYQLEFMRVPEHAAINETVNVAREWKKEWACGLINAVLRNVIRNKDAEKDKQTLAAQYAHPKWLVKKLQRAWPEQTNAIMEANNQHPPFFIRVNQQHHSRDEYLTLLNEQGFPAEAGLFGKESIRLHTPVPVQELPGFDQGWCSIQDEAAQLACNIMDPKPDQRILDACAAPGGKTCHLLEQEPQVASVVALDIDAQRLNRIEQNLQRLQLSASLTEGDASDPQAWWDNEPFDSILLDAPCSATGVIRRNPDIKLLRLREDIDKLAAVQSELLEKMWPLLKPGGKLVYATCSVLPEENELVVGNFVAKHDDAKEHIIDATWGKQVTFGRQLFPQKDQHDGFYYACLIKAL